MKKTIFPITRIHEPLQVDIEIENGKIVDAWTGGHLYRGFEQMLRDRDPRDASLITQRICGICSTAHGVVSAYTLRNMFQLQPTENGELLTNIIFGSDIMQNHLRHICLLTAFDYVKGPEMAPFTPHQPGDYRFSKSLNDTLVTDMFRGLDMAVRAHELTAIWGAKAPHVQTIIPTGVTTPVSDMRVSSGMAITQEILAFVNDTLIPAVQAIADVYKEYFSIGVGYGNFLSYGLFPEPRSGERIFKPGRVTALGEIKDVNTAQIREDVTYAWYKDSQVERQPDQSEDDLAPNKPNAYSWVKSPRYEGVPFEGGPLARLWINGQYRRGVSTMDRIMARVLELKMICELVLEWHRRLVPGQPTLAVYEPLAEGKGEGLTDAMRGPLGHWIEVKDYRIKQYSIVTPTAWNFSPRDAKGIKGPAEYALIGTSVQDTNSAIEVARVVHSFDPCFSCAVHLIDGRGQRIKRMI